MRTPASLPLPVCFGSREHRPHEARGRLRSASASRESGGLSASALLQAFGGVRGRSRRKRDCGGSEKRGDNLPAAARYQAGPSDRAADTAPGEGEGVWSPLGDTAAEKQKADTRRSPPSRTALSIRRGAQVAARRPGQCSGPCFIPGGACPPRAVGGDCGAPLPVLCDALPLLLGTALRKVTVPGVSDLQQPKSNG